MKCPKCGKPLQYVLEIRTAKPVTIPSKQLIYPEPKLTLEVKDDSAVTPKRRRRKTIKTEKEQVKPPKYVTIQEATLKLHWCPKCLVFVKSVE